MFKAIAPASGGSRLWVAGFLMGAFFAGFLLEGHVTPVAMGNPPFEDVFPIEHGDIRLLC